MPIQIIRNDITKIECDAIVNAANSSLLGGGGVDGAIHKAAGKGLLFECMKLGGCKVGQAKITGAHKLPARYVIHTVGPKWKGGNSGEKELLESCYRESLQLALEHECESVAFPLISSGVYGYPKDQALRVSIDTISGFLIEHDILVYIVVFDKSSFQISEKLFADIASYIDDKYVDAHFEFNRTRIDDSGESTVLGETRILQDDTEELFPAFAQATAAPKATLEEMVERIDESFSQMLLRKIDEKNMTDAECYKKANVDPKEINFVVQPLCQVNSSLPKGLEYIIDKCIKLNPDERYQTCMELRNDLNNYLQLPPKKGIFAKLFGSK